MTINVADDTVARFARQQHDWMERVLKGSLDPKEVASVVQKVIDRGGRITFTVIGTGLTGAEWLTRLEVGSHKPSDWARNILTKSDYDKNHRLEVGKEYKVALVFGKEIRKDSERTTANLKAKATQEFDQQSVAGLKGELALLIREKFTNAQLEEMGIWYIAVLHEPIIDSDGDAIVLYSGRYDGGSWVDACYGGPSDRWFDYGAFAFLAS